MTKTIIIQNNAFTSAITRLYHNGDITLEHYAQCLRQWRDNDNE